MHEPEGVGGKLGQGALVRLLLIPHLVQLLRQHKFKEAVEYVVSSVSREERVELARAAVEAMTGELTGIAAECFEAAVKAASVYGVIKLSWEWVDEGFKQIQEAHERGDAESLLGIYAYAWSMTILDGWHANDGAVTEEQRKACEQGVADGLFTRQVSPELPGLLLAEYRNKPAAVRALEVELYRRGGMEMRR
jgi:hypothetical protein